ncbi:MAG: hypothetical protein AAFR73_01200 [Pseudomonadota bacterium]
MGELVLATMLCSFLNGGATEIRHTFENVGTSRAVRIDCETPTHVIEVGLDKATSRDSVHQAVFASFLTGKVPVIIVIDTDGLEGRYEYEMRIVARQLGVAYGRCSQSFIERWAATAPFRTIGNDKSLDDLPVNATARSRCDLQPALSN